MDVKKIEELIEVLEHSSTGELSVSKGEISVLIRKAPKPRAVPAAPSPKKAQAAEAPAKAPEPASVEGLILAPMVGIFHATDGITNVGSTITEGQVVGAIESMKLLNDVVSQVSGIVSEAMVEDGVPVEYGQPLCRVEPI